MVSWIGSGRKRSWPNFKVNPGINGESEENYEIPQSG
jgi:hypothetical protein